MNKIMEWARLKDWQEWWLLGGLAIALSVAAWLAPTLYGKSSEAAKKPLKLVHHLDPSGVNAETEMWDDAQNEVIVTSGPAGKPVRTLRKGSMDTMNRGTPLARKTERRANSRPVVKESNERRGR